MAVVGVIGVITWFIPKKKKAVSQPRRQAAA